MKNDKICVILPCNIFQAPFYFRYENIINNLGLKFDLIIWDRLNINENANANIISYKKKITSNNGDKKKIFNFLKFGLFVKKHLKRGNYHKILILGSYSGTMAFLTRFLSKNHKNEYWLDIRDYTYEWFLPYKLAMAKVIKNSYATAISSKGFEKFLPSFNYIITHNIDIKTISSYNKEDRIPSEKIRISFIGNVRYYEENIKLLNIFKNDDRFILQYFGSGSDKLKIYCEMNNIFNVDFCERFPPEVTHELYYKTDIINNIYGSDGIELQTALSNKLYFSSALEIPILVSPKTYMSMITTKFGFGFDVDYFDINLPNKLYNWYININNKVKPDYSSFYQEAFIEDQIFEKKLVNYLTK